MPLSGRRVMILLRVLLSPPITLSVMWVSHKKAKASLKKEHLCTYRDSDIMKNLRALNCTDRSKFCCSNFRTQNSVGGLKLLQCS